ncbi:MAG: hypothetical protein FJ249_02560 [Nitrospira sp.]|nr:hypothetical protein [Nitrospira sp.]
MALAQQSGQTFLVAQVAEDLRSLFFTPIPAPSPSQLVRHGKAQPGQSLSQWIAGRSEQLLAGECRLRGREQFALLVRLPDWRAKLCYASALLFPTPDFMRSRYGPAGRGTLSFRYLARLLRLFWEGLQWLASLLTLPSRPRHN